MILLALNPNQENVKFIDSYVLRLCVSYSALSVITETFVFPLPRCQERVTYFGSSNGSRFYIKLNTR